ncbi:MAG: response regulator [Deltaproteobacteria bacterium]|nr:response regulator [Deltaproteobacteria bacterium]
MADKPTYEELEQRVQNLEQGKIECKRVENELRISKKLLRDVMDMVPAFICAKDLDGRFILANKKLTDFYGTTVEEITGVLHADICENKKELQGMLAADREVINGEKPKHIPEETMKNPDGSITVLETYKIPFTAYDDPAVLIVSTDITERKRAEEERGKLEAQFQGAQKLESVGRLAGGVAHDLNNLLAPILGYGEMLLQDFDRNDTRKASVEQIVEAGMRARDIVRQLLAFSRKQALEFKAVDLNKVLTRFEKLLRRTIREDIAIRFMPASQVPFIRGDIGQLEQVIMNLAVNAQDAMPEGGTLTFDTFLTELGEDYAATHEGVKSGAYVMLGVSDTGYGMGAETCEHLFEPFFSTKGEHGTGLGLATVYGIVKQHGGNIWVYSEIGKGTTFKIYLPVSEETGAPSESDSMGPPDLQGSETILIVEDNAQIRNLSHAILKRQGYKVLVAENGKEALTVLNQHEGPLHLILTDVVMPKMDGKALFDQISGYNPDVKVLYMSGYTNDVIAHRGVLDEGMNFIQKPCSVQALAAKVREVLDG